MASAPGGAGLPLLGDRTIDFYRDANWFVEQRIAQLKTRIFQTRLLNKPTLILGSSDAVREALTEKCQCMDLGYTSFMGQVYGDNILFMDGCPAEEMRLIMKHLFSADTGQRFQEIIVRLTAKAMDTLKISEGVQVYKFLKRLTTEICLSIFLDIDFETSSELANDIVALTTQHWHGIISIPVTIKLPKVSQTSGFTKALEAKAELLDLINKKLLNSPQGFPSLVVDTNFPKPQLAANHLLLFTSALVPKALASLLTSFVLELATKHDMQQDLAANPPFLQYVLLEVQRLWPPFVGGRRLVRKECTIGGYKVPAGHAVVYMTRQAQRDPDVFADPDEFIPDRWTGKNSGDKDKLFLFGAGSRCCVGQELVNNILQTVATALLKQFTWTCTDSQNLKYKWLPVSRPIDSVTVKFSPKTTDNDNSSVENHLTMSMPEGETRTDRN